MRANECQPCQLNETERRFSIGFAARSLGPVNTNAQSFDDEGKDDEADEEDIEFVEAAKNTAISLESAEKAFDFIAPTVGDAIVGPRFKPLGIGWHDWLIA